MRIHEIIWPADRVEHVAAHNVTPIEALAAFWENDDVTDFEDELEEVNEPVFERLAGATIQIELPAKEFAAIQRIAQEQHLDYTGLIRDWVLEKLYSAEMMRRVIKDFQAQS